MARSGLLPVFVDTSLDTHLAIAVSPSDTVASVKRKLASDHELGFPEVGQINIEALITRWQGKEYHLLETMSISDVLQMEGGCSLKALVATQLRPHTEINTSLKKKCKRNIASFEDTTTTRPTESRKRGEEFQGNVKVEVQEAIEEWMPVVEDAIPLDHDMPLEMVLYQPPESPPQT